MNASVFFWHTYNCNPIAESEKGIHKFICTLEELEKANLGPKRACKSYLANRFSKVFYALNIAYLILGVLNIKGGKKYSNSDIKPFDNLFNKVKFWVVMFFPLIREATCTLEYFAVNTCLQFNDFLLVNDLRAFMYDAKIKFTSKLKNPVGKQVSRIS